MANCSKSEVATIYPEEVKEEGAVEDLSLQSLYVNLKGKKITVHILRLY